jgi:hypothetical protein
MTRLGVAGIIGLLAAMFTATGVQAAPSSGFTGAWVGIDPVDGSTQHLYVQGGANAQVQYVDDFGTTCVHIGAPTTIFTAVLTGTVSGNELDAWFKAARCGPKIVLSAANRFSWTFLYDDHGTADPSDDTIYGALNDGPTTWQRA